MTIEMHLPPSVEAVLASRGGDASRVLLEAALVELYRREAITHHELAESLGLGRLETDAFLKAHGVQMPLTIEQHRAQMASLRANCAR